MAELPDFDTLLAMHREDPEALERLRNRLTTELVESASAHTRQRLEGLQFRINMELRRAGNPTAGFLRLSTLMHEAFSELNFYLNSPADVVRAREKARQQQGQADILQFRSGRQFSGSPDPRNRH